MNSRHYLLPMLLFVGNCASANTYFVSPSGNGGAAGTETDPFFLIQEAVENCISVSDTIYLAEGSYWQHFTIEDKDGIYISSIDPLNKSTLSGSGVEGLNQIEISNANNIHIANIILREHFIQDANAIYMFGEGSNLLITDCEFYDIGWGNDPLADPENFSPIRQAHAILINGRTETGIQNIYLGRNHFHNVIVGNSECITLTGNTYDFLIEDNVLEDITNIGIDIAGHFSWALPVEIDETLNQSRNGRIRRNLVRRCRRPTAGNEPAGIYIDGGANVIVDRNEVYENGTGISIGCENAGKTASGITIANNVIYNNDKFGSVFGANAGNLLNSTLRNNSFYNNGIFFDNSGSISIQKSADSFITDNIVYITDEAYYGISAFGFAVENLMIVRNQLYSDDGLTPRVFAFSPADESSSIVLNMPFQNPELVSLVEGDYNFNLQNTSPCINEGNPSFSLLPEEFDFYGNTREISIVDIGAAEGDFVDAINGASTFNFKLFPNPTNGQLIVQASSEIESIRVIDSTGKNLISVNNTLNEHHIDLSHLDSGIYLIEVRIVGEIVTEKLIVY